MDSDCDSDPISESRPPIARETRSDKRREISCASTNRYVSKSRRKPLRNWKCQVGLSRVHISKHSEPYRLSLQSASTYRANASSCGKYHSHIQP